MTTVRKTYFNRNDTMLGVCEAIGDDMGISANWLRIAFAVAFFFYPLQAALAYLALGGLGWVLRRVWPDEVGTSEADTAVAHDAANAEADVRLAA